MQTRRWLIVLWVCFLARLSFYAMALPLWEGYDEWPHFVVIRLMALHHQALVAREAPILRDVKVSLELAPVPWELRNYTFPSITQDQFWMLPAQERAARENAFRMMPTTWSREDAPGGLQAYEALQPPLYYWLMAPAMYLMRDCSMSVQVLVLRWLSVLIASLTVPLAFGIGEEIFRDARTALGCSALVAVMPGLALDVARVGNDCVSVVLFSAAIWWGLKKAADHKHWALYFGVIVGCGLLAKAYFLTLVLAIALFFKRRSIPILLVSVLVGGWWYLRNLLTNGTLSGLSEAVELRQVGSITMLKQAMTISWPRAIDTILLSHFYFGGWSSLTVRSWIYHVFYLIAFIAFFGTIQLLRRKELEWLGLVYGTFWLGQFYNVVLLFVRKGLPGSMGWYMYAVVGAEVSLCAIGLFRILPRWLHRGILPFGILLFGLLDLYTMNIVAIPYYTGMIRHRANGAIAALHFSEFKAIGFHETFTRLATFKPMSGDFLIVLWSVYLLATAAIIAAELTTSLSAAVASK
jgi:hypothetical protein